MSKTHEQYIAGNHELATWNAWSRHFATCDACVAKRAEEGTEEPGCLIGRAIREEWFIAFEKLRNVTPPGELFL